MPGDAAKDDQLTLWAKARAAENWLVPRLGGIGMQAAILALVAIVMRASCWGNPAIQVDEQFYLLVGDRMWHGAIPFVDIWDRKPVGLFLIYAAIRLLGGGGILQYQLVATLFAIATALTITRIATRVARPPGALLAGIAYLVWLDVFGAEGGQSPVFYDLPMALAGLIVLDLWAERDRPWRGRSGIGATAMLLCGLAIQIKYTAVFEGTFFGLMLMVTAWWRDPRPALRLGEALVWALCGLLPTLAALLYFESIGDGKAFVFANFVSIFGRVGSPPSVLLDRLWIIVRGAAPLLIGAVLALWPSSKVARPDGPDGPARAFVTGWVLAALAGLLIFGSYYDHYFLPVLVPLTIACAPLLEESRIRLGLTAFDRHLSIPVGAVVLICGIAAAHDALHRNARARGGAVEIQALVDVIKPRLTDCLYVYDGEPILYYLTGSCLPTHYVFPNHLNSQVEVGATGVDASAEVRRIMAGKPHLVVMTEPPVGTTNPDTLAIMTAAMARDYHSIFSIAIGKQQRVVYERLAGQ